MTLDSLPASATVAPLAVGAADEYCSVEQAATVLGLHRVTIWRWITSGRLPAFKAGPRSTRIRRSDLQRVLTAIAPADVASTSDAEHFVQFYESDEFLLDSITEYIGRALRAGEVGIVVATSAHRQGLEARLRGVGIDLDTARSDGRFVALDAAETLAQFMVDASPDPERFAQVIGGILTRASALHQPVRVFGEMVALLWADENSAGAIRLEELWNTLRATHSFSLFCAYPMQGLGGSTFQGSLDDVCVAHARVIPAESYSGLSSVDEGNRTIARLQQRAASLELEIRKRERVEDELRLSREELRDFVENATEPMHWVDAGGTVVWANRAEMEMLGYAPDEYIGHPIAEFHADADVIADILTRLSQGEELHGYEAPLRCKDGSIRVVAINSNVYCVNGEFVHTRCFSRDITEQKHLERMQQEFVAMAAHELRTPLTSLKGFTQIMRRRQAYDEGAADTIVRQVGRLDRLVGQLLDASRLDTGRFELTPLPIDLRDLAQRCVTAAQALSDRHTVRVVMPDCAVEGQWDAERLEQVFENLLGNAVKYSPDGGEIIVTIQDAGDYAHIAVQDHGVGIAADAVARVFDRFYRVESTAHTPGLGLGLYITRSLVEAHGGELFVESAGTGLGSTFHVKLPYESSATAVLTDS